MGLWRRKASRHTELKGIISEGNWLVRLQDPRRQPICVTTRQTNIGVTKNGLCDAESAGGFLRKKPGDNYSFTPITVDQASKNVNLQMGESCSGARRINEPLKMFNRVS